MGVLFDEELGLEVGSEYYKIRPVERLLGIGDVEHEARIVHYYDDMPSFFADGRRIFSINQILLRDGGLILGEGDSGKSVYVNMLRDAAAVVGPVKLIHLRSDLQDGSTIQDCVKEVIAQVHNQAERATLIFDGLDENEKYGKELKTVLADSRIFQECRIWVASRPCAAAAALSGSVVAGMVYKLLPISHQDIHKIVEQVDAVSEEEFLKIVKEAHLESFLRKPGGVIVLLKLFANGNLKVTGRDAAMLNIAEDYARAMRDGQIEDLGDEGFSDRDLVDCAGWIATCLFFSGKDSIWRGRASDSPAMALRQEDLPLGFYDERIINEVLLRRLFEPLESVRLRITYADMANYLAGWWMGRHFLISEINKLIKNVQVVSPDLGGVGRARTFAERLKAPLAIIDKRRPQPGVAEVMNLIGDVKDKNAVLIDDMVDTAGSLCEAARALKAKGAKSVYACCTHAVLTDPAASRIRDSEIEELVVTNTIPVPPQKMCDKIKVLTIAPVLAETIRAIYNDGSVSALFKSITKNLSEDGRPNKA